VVLIFLGFAIRARRLFFFANVNPAIPLGGAFGESKSAILSLLPIRLTGGWVVLERGVSAEVVEAEMEAILIVTPARVIPHLVVPTGQMHGILNGWGLRIAVQAVEEEGATVQPSTIAMP